MLVYGDRSETVDPRAYAEGLRARWASIGGLAVNDALVPAARDQQERHTRLVRALIDAGKLAQAVADAAVSEANDDFTEPATHSTQQLVNAIARELTRSWTSGLEEGWAPLEQSFATLLQVETLPEAVAMREPEGYAFYSLYPESYWNAASRRTSYDRPSQFIGLRSIGTSLAAMASTAAFARVEAFTVRPGGDPHDRTIQVSSAARRFIGERSEDDWFVADEGPGLSGSSFSAAVELLQSCGVDDGRITLLPSHRNGPGPAASHEQRSRVSRVGSRVVDFEELLLPSLAGWVEPLIGPLTEPLQDFSGGLWRSALGIDAPAWPEQERRKYLAVTEQGRFLLKFAGLGGVGERKRERAEALASSGFTLAPVGLAHGLLVEPLLSTPSIPAHAGTQTSRALRAPSGPSDAAGDKQVWAPAFAGEFGEGELEQVGRYLGFRARELAPPHGAAADDLLRIVMRRNFGLAELPPLAELADRLPDGERGPPCAIDGRLHAWEWRRASNGQLVKLDALDHCEAHDLIGSQDVAWDLAGAAVELRLSPDAAERLRRITAAEARQAIDPGRVAFQTLAYLAFQIGWWTFAAQASEGARAQAEVDRYKDTARSFAA